MPWFEIQLAEDFVKPENWDLMIDRLISLTANEFDCPLSGVEYREVRLEETRNAYAFTVKLEFSVPTIGKLIKLPFRMRRQTVSTG